MKRKITLFLFLILMTSFLLLYAISPSQDANITANATTSQSDIAELEQKIINISKNAQKSVVAIRSTKRMIQRRHADPFFDFFERFFDMPQQRRRRFNPKRESMGSGFVIDSKKGIILTNAHVIDEAEKIVVTVDRKDYDAEVIGIDKETDIGVLQLKKFNEKDIRELEFEDSDKLQVGSFVIAVGNPFGLSNTVTFGVVSATGRSGVNVAEYEDFIQTDAAINPGNSGGPLLNKKGKVIGMNTAIFSKSGGYMGIGFAVPSNMVQRISRQLISGEKIKRAYMGVTIQELTEELRKHLNIQKNVKGVLISSVAKNSPAEKAGIKEGDVITHFNKKSVDSTAKLKNTVAFSDFNKKYPLRIIRNGKVKKLRIVLDEEFSFQTATGKNYSDDFGFTFEEKEKQIIITDVDNNSLAMHAGLRKGDRILSVNRKKITSATQVKKILDNNKSVLLLIQRGQNKFFVSLNK